MLKDLIAISIDDEQNNNLLIEGMGKEIGLHVKSFQNPLVALDHIQNNRIDLIFADYLMPELDGISLIKQVKATHPDIPVVLISAQDEKEEEFTQKALAAGASVFLKKPLDIAAFTACVSKILHACHPENPPQQVDERVENAAGNREIVHKKQELVGKIRHDIRKVTQIIMDMTTLLTPANQERAIEDIKHEVTALQHIIHSFEATQNEQESDLTKIIWDFLIPFISASSVSCTIDLIMEPSIPPVAANSAEVGRALMNLISNALDAIKESTRKGIITIEIRENEDTVVIEITDNGIGIEERRLEKGPDSLPLFVGMTSKGITLGSGTGTKQVFSVFGAENIEVKSEVNKYTAWRIQIQKKKEKAGSKRLHKLESRYLEFQNMPDRTEDIHQTGEIGPLIRQTGKMEVLLFDLVFQFSRYHNIRNIFIPILTFLVCETSIEEPNDEMAAYRIDDSEIKTWIISLLKKIKAARLFINQNSPMNDKIRGEMLKSYNQAGGRTIVFALDPETGNFYAADRALVEHSDLAHYHNKENDCLLRGDFRGDLDNESDPLYLGLWSVSSKDDLIKKLQLIRTGVDKLIAMGVKPGKPLFFYSTISNRSMYDLNSYRSVRLGDMAHYEDKKLEEFIIEQDDELQGLVLVDY